MLAPLARGIALLSRQQSGPPLDGFPAVTAAYSTGRRLLSSYVTNKSVNIRRASDNATTDIGFMANNRLDTPTLSGFLTATTGFNTTWYDQGGGGLDLAQGTAGNQPQIIIAESTMNNRPVAKFVRASSQSLSKAVAALLQPFTISVVAQRTGNVTLDQAVFDGAVANAVLYFHLANSFNSLFGTAQSVTATDNIPHALMSLVNGASSYISVDGVASAPANQGANNIVGYNVGTDFTTTAILDGFLSELIIFPSILSDANRIKLQANQRAFWGTA